jgi:hypothetical protein
MRPIALLAVVGLAAPFAHAQDREWLNPVSGLWTDVANWSGMNFPNTTSENAIIAVPGTYTATVNTIGATQIGSLRLLNPDATVAVNPSAQFNINADSVNNGLLTVNLTSSSGNGLLNILSDLTFSGSGTLTLGGGPNDAQLNSIAGAVFTNAPGHTIDGTGELNAVLVNDGIVRARDTGFGTVLEIQGEDKVNNNRMESSFNARLQIDPLTIDQSAGGTIDAVDGEVVFASSTSTIIGGTLDASAGGTIDRASGTTILDDVTLLATLSVQPGGNIEITGSGITNNGRVRVNPTSSSTNSLLTFRDSGSLFGTGTVELVGGVNDAQLNTITGMTVTNTVDHTIEGSGDINAALTNDGLILARTLPTGSVLQLQGEDKVNNATIAAELDARLEILGITIDQTGGGIIDARDGTTRFTGSTSIIRGGTVAASSGGVTERTSGITELESVTITDSFVIDPSGTVLVSGNGLTNNGVIDANPTNSSSNSILRFESSGTLGGTGTVILGGGPNDAQIVSADDVTVTHAATHTIMGSGEITTDLVNDGDIIAMNGAFGNVLQIKSENAVNNASMLSSAGAILEILTGVTITQSGTGLIDARDGAIEFTGIQTVIGGTIDASAGGAINREAGGPLTLDAVTLNGDLTIDPGGNVEITSGGLTSNATIRVNPTNSSSNGLLAFRESATLGGTGTVFLGGGVNDSQITTDADPAVIGTVGPDHTITGSGDFNGNLVVHGTIDLGFAPGDTVDIDLGGIDRSLTLSPTTVINVDLLTPAAHDRFERFSVTHAASINGTLNVDVDPAYNPLLGDEFDIFESGGPTSGTFATLNVNGLPAGYELIQITRNDEYVLRVINPDCAADLAEPYGELTFGDISSFLAAFDAGETTADLATPFGQFTFGDISAFLASFTVGCP